MRSKTIEAIKDPFLIFLIVLILSILGVFWLFPEYREGLPLSYTYMTLIAAIGVAVMLGTWVRLVSIRQDSLFAAIRQERDSLLAERERNDLLATVQREKDNLLKDKEELKRDLRETRDGLQYWQGNFRRCQEMLARSMTTNIQTTTS